MTTQWNGAMFQALSQTAVEQLGKNLIQFSGAVATDFTSQALEGQTLTSRLVKHGTVKDLSDNDVAGDYSKAQDTAGSNALVIEMSQHPITAFALTDVEVAEMSKLIVPGLIAAEINVRMNDIAVSVADSLAANIASANFGNCASKVAAANFDAGEVAKVYAACAKAGMPLNGSTSLVLNADYIAALFSDPVFASFQSSQEYVVRDGALKSAFGMSVYNWPILNAGTNIQGFATSGTGLVMAMRAVPLQDETQYMYSKILQDPKSKAVMTYAAYYSKTKRAVVHEFDTVFGTAVGDPKAVVLIGNASAN
jgi:hypothetical protein